MWQLLLAWLCFQCMVTVLGRTRVRGWFLKGFDVLLETLLLQPEAPPPLSGIL